MGSRWLTKKKNFTNMDLSKFAGKAQGLLGKMSEVKQEISEKASEATHRAAESISTKSSEIKEKAAAFKLEDIITLPSVTKTTCDPGTFLA